MTTGASALNASSASADRKSTRLNSSHQIISYAVFCLKKKNKTALAHIVTEQRPTFAPRTCKPEHPRTNLPRATALTLSNPRPPPRSHHPLHSVKHQPG